MKTWEEIPWGQNGDLEKLNHAHLESSSFKRDLKVYSIVGPNGVGKSTIIEALLEQNLGVQRVTRYTTKTLSEAEQGTQQYKQLTLTEFLQLEEDGGFLEWSKYMQGLYGTHVEELIAMEKQIGILDIDLDGALMIKRSLIVLNITYSTIFISPVEKDLLRTEAGIDQAIRVLRERILKRNRGEDLEEFKGRLRNAKETLRKSVLTDYIFANKEGNIQETIGKFIDLMKR